MGLGEFRNVIGVDPSGNFISRINPATEKANSYAPG